MRNIAIGFALLSLAYCSGCATIYTHCHHDESNDPLQTGAYRGVRSDVDALKESGPLWDAGPLFVLAFFPVIDLPLSAVADTFTYPFDLKHPKKASTTQDASDSWAQSPVASAAKFQTNSFVFYDSKTNRFATVTPILSVPASQARASGRWRGELSATYTGPLTNIVLASDKLSMINWHPLICKHDRENPSAFVILLHPDQPDDYITVKVPALTGTVSGHRNYATDGGLVDSE